VTVPQHETHILDEARSPRNDGDTDNEQPNIEDTITAGFPSNSSPQIVTPPPGIDQQRASSPKLTGNIPFEELRETTNNTEKSPITSMQEKTLTKEGSSQVPTMEKGKEPAMEHFYTVGSLGSTLSWGDQQILEPVDEVVDVQAISYDKKRKAVMKRTVKRRRFTLDNTLFVTTEETLFDTEHTKVSELLGAGMAITDATLDREKRDEQEATSMRKELEHLRHQAEYYQDTTQETILLKGDLMEVYSQFKSERDIFMARIEDYQEDTLMGMVTYKDMQ
jgi:hypothetical protein